MDKLTFQLGEAGPFESFLSPSTITILAITSFMIFLYVM